MKYVAATIYIVSIVAMLTFLTIVMGCKETTTPVPAPIPVAFDIPGYQISWSAKVKEQLDMTSLNKAKVDMKRFCPKYDALTLDQQKLAWGYLIGAMTKYESGYNVKEVYKESNNTLSEGLFQLTYGNKFCPKKKSEGDLQDPLVNITCALKLMAYYTDMDGVVAAGGYTSYGAPSPKGLARYWSVIRVKDTKSAHHLADIITMTKKAPGCN